MRFCAATKVSYSNCADEAALRRVLGQHEFAAALISGTTAEDRKILASHKWFTLAAIQAVYRTCSPNSLETR